jgi:methyl-accepting chemotaxis protein
VLAKLKITWRLAIAVVLPALALATLAAYNLSVSWNSRTEMVRLGVLAQGVGEISRLIHELQRERGASAVFVGSKGAQLRNEVAAQRKLTDGRRVAAVTFMGELRAGAGSTEAASAIAQALSAALALDGKREEIDAFKISALESNSYFTATIEKLLLVTGAIAKASTRGDATTAISAYVNFMQGKERAGQERASGAAGISAGRFQLANYRRVLGLANAQEAYFESFETAAAPADREFFKQTMAGAVTDKVVQMREIVLLGGLTGEMPGLDGKAWYDATTARIDQLKIVEDRIAASLIKMTDAISADAARGFTVLAFVAVVAFVLCLVLVVIMARSITGPLGRLRETMEHLADGNLMHDVAGLDRSDEIGAMAQTVAVFKANAVERQRLEVEKHASETHATEKRKADMRGLADEFETAIGDIIETVSAASIALETAAGTLTHSAETTQQLSGLVATASERASANVQSVASATEEMSSSVNEISRQVQESSRIAGEAVKQAQHTDARINELSQAASRIGDVVKLITSVAEQTNLLALNATIEAARAGDAGRGFAVVASEVKQLASQTAKATEEISTQIASMQSATQDSVSAIKEIGGTIGRISEITSAIAAAVEEQGAATGEISRNVGEAARGTAMVASSITDVNRGAGETGSASTQVLASAQSLSSESNRLKLEVDKFLMTVRAA